MNPVVLTQRLLAFDTMNPPGNEAPAANFLADILETAGFKVAHLPWEENRSNIVADFPGNSAELPLVFSGHIDTVPLGSSPWSRDPFAGVIDDGAIYGRGSSDMKAGIAAMVCAATRFVRDSKVKRPIRIVLTGGEETGCLGAKQLQQHGVLADASGIVIGEPTNNYPALGHKGALFVRCRTTGVTAHSSMPEEGVNAIYKAVRAITKVEHFNFDTKAHALLGAPTLNVGMVSGGLNVNSVPDKAEFTVDVRSVRGMDHVEVLRCLQAQMGDEVSLEPFVDLAPVATDRENPFVQCVFSIMQDALGSDIVARALPFFTDGCVFSEVSPAPIVILGPGDPKMAHKTDEYCRIEKIDQASECYLRILQAWCG